MDNKEFYTRTFLENTFLLENIQGGIVYSDFDPPFALRYATEGMAQLTGYTQDELLDLVQMDIVWDEDRPALAEDVARQFALGDTFEIEYRLKRKDGSYIYVLDRAKVVDHDDGNKYIHCLLTDITDLKLMEQALQLSQEKYKLAVQQSGHVILDYDLATTELTFSENYPHIFFSSAPNGTLEALTKKDWINPSCLPTFINAIASTSTKNKISALELQIKDGDGHYVWCNLHLSPICTSSGIVYAIAGCLQNIDHHKKEVATLTERSQKDGLTNIYNRVTMEEFINKTFSTTDRFPNAALIILDIDYFKKINDENGHAFGDDILIALTKEVSRILPPRALFGRLGGDEFLIFIADLTTIDTLEGFSQKIVETLHSSIHQTSLTVSLGVALCSLDCNNFNSLYRNADIALYQTKERGRNGYTIYNN